MALYIKATKQVSDKLGVTAIRNKTADGNYLLWQADLNGIPGDTIFKRAAYVGGKHLTNVQAKQETDGTDHPVEVYTPDIFKDEEDYNPPTVEQLPAGGTTGETSG